MAVPNELSIRVKQALFTAYNQKALTKPLKELSDTELLFVHNLGHKALEEIRKVVPAPAGEPAINGGQPA